MWCFKHLRSQVRDLTNQHATGRSCRSKTLRCPPWNAPGLGARARDGQWDVQIPGDGEVAASVLGVARSQALAPRHDAARFRCGLSDSKWPVQHATAPSCGFWLELFFEQVFGWFHDDWWCCSNRNVQHCWEWICLQHRNMWTANPSSVHDYIAML